MFAVYTVFIVLAVGAAAFIFFFKDKTDDWVKDYASKIRVCENLTDENECFSTKSCEGIFAPSCPDCQDMVFVRCQGIPLKVAVALEAEKELCEDTNGRWHRNKYGSYCVCGQPGVSFDSKQGCRNK